MCISLRLPRETEGISACKKSYIPDVRSGTALKSTFFIVLKIFKTQIVSPEEGRHLLPKCTLSVFMKMEKVLLNAAHFILRAS